MKTYGEVDKWTVERVKEELPMVRVRWIDRTIYLGCIAGRKEKFPTVSIETMDRWIRVGEFAWETLTRSLNTGNALEV